MDKGNKKPEKTIYIDTNNNEINIFAKLYSQGMKKIDDKNFKAEKLFQEINYGNKENINNSTDEIFNKIKNETFKKIFLLLDNDYDDVITGTNIFKGLKNLPLELQKIIEPLALQLQEENETLIEAEFIRAMEDLYSLSSYNDKRILISFYKNYKNKKIKDIKNSNNNNNEKNNAEKFYDTNLRIKLKDDFCIEKNDKKNSNRNFGSINSNNINNNEKRINMCSFKVFYI